MTGCMVLASENVFMMVKQCSFANGFLSMPSLMVVAYGSSGDSCYLLSFLRNNGYRPRFLVRAAHIKHGLSPILLAPATHWKQTDPLTWSFDFRKGAKFDNGNTANLSDDDAAMPRSRLVRTRHVAGCGWHSTRMKSQTCFVLVCRRTGPNFRNAPSTLISERH